jgi:hypothetical protein
LVVGASIAEVRARRHAAMTKRPHIGGIDLPNGHVTWHIPDSELPLFDFLSQYEGAWDSHTTAQKYARVVNPGL